MKKITALLVLFSGFYVNAEPRLQSGCLDSNFDGVEVGFPVSKLQYLNRFNLLYSGRSPAPAGIAPLHVDDNICFATKAAYLEHQPSKKVYVVFTTSDDYCDGGNTSGAIIDLDKYVDQQLLEGSVVARIADGEVYCNK